MADSSSSSSSSGGNLWSTIASLGTTTITGLFNASANKKALALKAQEQQFQQSLVGLNNEQQYVLQTQLNAAKNDTERYAILTNAVTQLKLNQQTNTTSEKNKATYTIIAVVILLIVVLVIVKRD